MTNITAAHREQFEALRKGEYGNFVLFSCFVNDEPTAAICAVCEDGAGRMDIIPLFVAVTPGMKLTDHEGRETVED